MRMAHPSITVRRILASPPCSSLLIAMYDTLANTCNYGYKVCRRPLTPIHPSIPSRSRSCAHDTQSHFQRCPRGVLGDLFHLRGILSPSVPNIRISTALREKLVRVLRLPRFHGGLCTYKTRVPTCRRPFRLRQLVASAW
ncbi:hypothetical protein OF83DRAFT_1145813 [Amylostereum chailletii]|nr:hypothetical protein OF83DRAFT_1145813 [Amylostereum chailletii]